MHWKRCVNQNLQSFIQHNHLLTCLINISALCDRAAELESHSILLQSVDRRQTGIQIFQGKNIISANVLCSSEEENVLIILIKFLKTKKHQETLPPHFQIGLSWNFSEPKLKYIQSDFRGNTQVFSKYSDPWTDFASIKSNISYIFYHPLSSKHWESRQQGIPLL